MNNSNLIEKLPEMLSGKDLYDRLTDIPEYSEEIRLKGSTERLMALSTLYDIYLPSEMSVEIYSKLYLALVRSLQKKCTQAAVQQSYQNHHAIMRRENRGIIGGSDSFSIVGCSGIGKSSAINRAISIITDNRMIDIKNPAIRIIPCLVVQCPWDASVKSLLLEILRNSDELLETDYYSGALKVRATTDVLIGIVSQVSLQHIGLLIIDEIQNCVTAKGGKGLVAMLTQLINSSGISIGLVGTPETLSLFESAFQLARRSLGLQYNTLNNDEYFSGFCKLLFKYQYIQNNTEITPQIIEWLYEHSGGVTSVVVSLIHDAHEIAILTGYEILDVPILNQAYEKRIQLLHDYIRPAVTVRNITAKRKKKVIGKITEACDNDCSISELVQKSKDESKQRKIAFEYVRLCGYKNGEMGNGREKDSQNGNAKLTLDEIAKQLGTSKTNLTRALSIERNLTELMKQLLDDGVISKTVASDLIAPLSDEEQIELINSLDTTKKITGREIQEYISKNKELETANEKNQSTISALQDQIEDLDNQVLSLTKELQERPTVQVKVIPKDYNDLRSKAEASDKYKRQSEAYRQDYHNEQLKSADNMKKVLELKSKVQDLEKKLDEVRFGDIGGKSADHAIPASIFFCARAALQ